MSSNYFERQAFPHENDANFERTLRNISSQEVMPRPMAASPGYLEPTDFSGLFGDTWHWDSLSVGDWVALVSRYTVNLGLTTIAFGGIKFLVQPLAKPFVLLYRHFKGVVQYTLLMDPPVPLRYNRMVPRAWLHELFPLFPRRIGQEMAWAFKYFFLRAPVFTIGTYIGSRLLWALEDWKGEDAMIHSRMPIMIGSGLLTYSLVFHRNRFTNFARAPAFVFITTFLSLWYIDNAYLRKRGFDAVWNPLDLKLPNAIVQVLSGDPFNGDLIAGPIRYALLTTSSALGKLIFRLKDSVTPKSDNDDQHGDNGPPPSAIQVLWNHATTSYKDQVEKSIESIEENALREQGFLPEESPSKEKLRRQVLYEEARIEHEFHDSVLNPLNYIPAYKDRLSSPTLDFVNFLWGKDYERAVTPYMVARPTNEIVFGNLLSGIEQSGSQSIVEDVRQSLQANSTSPSPSLLGPASQPGFFARQHRKAQVLSEDMVNDPVGALLAPVSRFFQTVSAIRLFRSEFAFDDQRPGATSPIIAKTTATEASLTQKRSQSASKASHSQTSDLGLDFIPVELPPLIPHDVAQRQVDRYFETKAAEFSWAKTSEALSTMIPDQQALENVISTTTSTLSSLITKTEEEDVAMAILRQEQDNETRDMLPEGVTPEMRLRNFVRNVGGQDFEEPTQMVAESKMSIVRSGRWYNHLAPIVGERKREILNGALESLRRLNHSVREVHLPMMWARYEEDAERARMHVAELEEKRKLRLASLEKSLVKPVKAWFSGLKAQFFSDNKS